MAVNPGASHYAARMGPSPRVRVWKYDGWRRGQNSFAEDNEIRDDEFYEGVNVEIVGKSSIQMPRRGHQTFATISGATSFNGWGVYKNPVTGANFLLAMFSGHLYKVTAGGVVTEIDPGITWDTTAKMRGILLRDYFYFGNGVDYMAKTDGDTVTQWTNITAPTFSTLALTGSGSTTVYAYAVTAVTDVGETEVSAILDEFGPTTLDNSNYFTLTWVRKTDSVVRGYNIYRSVSGGTMTLLTFVDQQTAGANMTYTDKGTIEQSLIYEYPTFNTTGGVKGNIFAKYANTLFISGNLEEPDTIFYGGTGAKWESFNPADNGGWVKPGRGDGERSTAMIGFDDFLFMFKENSIWKFTFGSDGAPTLVASIPQYGTSSPDTVWRMEKDVVFLGTDGRIRILGYEPSQLNVIRTSDISNRIQNDIDALDKTTMDDFFGAFFEQKFIVGNGEVAYPYDRRYTGFLGEWTGYEYDRFIVWDKATGKQMLFGAQGSTGKIFQLLVDGAYDDDGTSIPTSFRPKRIDGGEDTILKYFYDLKIKLKNSRGNMTLYTYKDGSTLISTRNVTFDIGGGIGEYMFDEAMFDEGVTLDSIPDAIFIVKKNLDVEAYSYYPQIVISGNEYNHCIVQTMNGRLEAEDWDYERDEVIID